MKKKMVFLTTFVFCVIIGLHCAFCGPPEEINPTIHNPGVKLFVGAWSGKRFNVRTGDSAKSSIDITPVTGIENMVKMDVSVGVYATSGRYGYRSGGSQPWRNSSEFFVKKDDIGYYVDYETPTTKTGYRFRIKDGKLVGEPTGTQYDGFRWELQRN